MAKDRQSNIELLRIIAMMMIVMHHLCLYAWPTNATFPVEILRNLLLPGGKIGVDVFVLISGYFLSRGSIHFLSFLKLLFQAWFYATVLGGTCWVFCNSNFDMTAFIKSFLPGDGGLPWFVTSYLGMYLFAPWLAKLAAILDKRQFDHLIIVGFVVFSLLPIIPGCTFVTSGFSWFCFLFLVACYIRKFEIDRSVAAKLLFGGVLFLFAAVLGSEAISIVFDGAIAYVIKYLMSMNAAPIAITSIGLFCLFKNLDIKCIKLVNLLAEGTFGVYLIHENVFIRDALWQHFCFVFSHGVYLTLPLVLCSVFIVFVVLDTVDLLRLKVLEEPLLVFASKHFCCTFDNIDRFLNGQIGAQLKTPYL